MSEILQNPEEYIKIGVTIRGIMREVRLDLLPEVEINRHQFGLESIVDLSAQATIEAMHRVGYAGENLYFGIYVPDITCSVSGYRYSPDEKSVYVPERKKYLGGGHSGKYETFPPTYKSVKDFRGEFIRKLIDTNRIVPSLPPLLNN